MASGKKSEGASAQSDPWRSSSAAMITAYATCAACRDYPYFSLAVIYKEEVGGLLRFALQQWRRLVLTSPLALVQATLAGARLSTQAGSSPVHLLCFFLFQIFVAVQEWCSLHGLARL